MSEVLRAFPMCTKRQQSALVFCLGRGLRGAEVGKVLGLSRGTVNRDIAEALERIRALVREEP